MPDILDDSGFMLQPSAPNAQPSPPRDQLIVTPDQLVVAGNRLIGARDQLIVALDVPNAHQALALIERLEDSCRWFKVGLELYLAAGNAVIEALVRRGYSVFLDLKLHDIPNTVAGAVRSVSELGVEMLTLHASGGPEMLRAAVEAAKSCPSAPELLAVTVLTSMDDQQLHAVGVEAVPRDQVELLAKLAQRSGIRGLVCSAQEVAAMRAALGPAAILLVPGIRPSGLSRGTHHEDQKRTGTPAEAIRDGASYLVVGRPITQADHPLQAAQGILAEIDAALRKTDEA